MSLKSLHSVFLILLITSVVLLPVLMGASIIGLGEEDDFADEDDFSFIHSFSSIWILRPVCQVSALLGAGLSMFTLFVVYLGGRSKHRRFNDRTIDPVNLLMAALTKTALFRAVFIFLLFIPDPLQAQYPMVRIFCTIPIPTLRRKKL